MSKTRDKIRSFAKSESYKTLERELFSGKPSEPVISECTAKILKKLEARLDEKYESILSSYERDLKVQIILIENDIQIIGKRRSYKRWIPKIRDEIYKTEAGFDHNIQRYIPLVYDAWMNSAKTH